MITTRSRKDAKSVYILFLLMFNVVTSMPVAPPKRSPAENVEETMTPGFSTSPKVLEIQLPLKIASQDDLIAWGKYVMGLMASRINITLSTLKDAPIRVPERHREPVIQEVPSRTIVGQSLTSGRNKQPEILKAPGSRTKPANSMPSSSPSKPIKSKPNSGPQQNLPIVKHSSYSSSVSGLQHQRKSEDVLPNTNVMLFPPTATFFPLPLDATDGSLQGFLDDDFITKYFYDTVEPNLSTAFESMPLRREQYTKPNGIFMNEPEDTSPIRINDVTVRANVTNSGTVRPVLTVPFEAFITITRDKGKEPLSSRTQTNDYFAVPVRDPPDEFPPYFDKNFTLTNESEQINVVFEDEKEPMKAAKVQTKKPKKQKQSQKQKQGQKQNQKQKTKKSKSRKRQATAIGDLLKMLGILRKTPKNTTEVDGMPLLTTVLKGPQKFQLTTREQPPPLRGRKNETSPQFEKQEEFDDDDDDDNDDDKGGNDDGKEASDDEDNGGDGDEKEEDDEEPEPEDEDEESEDEEEEEEQGGSLDALLDLLPLAAPLLEDLSDPETDTDIGELLEAAIPLLQGLSEVDEDGEGFDSPGIVVPILMNIFGGADGTDSDSSSVVGPLIQLIAPLIGPVVGPFIGPILRSSSNPPPGGGSSGSIVQSLVGPLSQAAEVGGLSPFSSIIASVVSALSKNIGTGGSDLSGLVSAVVSGSIAGTSAGMSGGSKGHKDSYYAPTNYGGYGPAPVPANSVNPSMLVSMSFKDIIGAILRLVTTIINGSTGLSAASSKESKQPSTYGPPPAYGPPSYAAPTRAPYTMQTRAPYMMQTRSPYSTAARSPQRQIRQQKRF